MVHPCNPLYSYAVDCDNYVITVCETMLKLVLLVTLIAAILPTDGEFYSSSESFVHGYSHVFCNLYIYGS